MNAIEIFQQKKRQLDEAREWAALIGKPYRGGGGGVGEVRKACVGLTVYHQESDGATNYHNSSTALNRSLDQVVLADASSIIGRALDLMAADVAEAARKARAEAEAVLAMAGGAGKEGERG